MTSSAPVKHALVSIIIPIHNGAPWIEQCFNAIIQQHNLDKIGVEVCVCNDASTDNTLDLLHIWTELFARLDIDLKVHDSPCPSRGVGYAKNRAVAISRGTYLCFQDIDDIMLPERIYEQYSKAVQLSPYTIIGCQFQRKPDNSTVRYTRWANSLSQDQLELEIFTSHGPTVIMPTWFCHRLTFERVGGFSEKGRGTPEDLIFFYKHLDLGGKICRVDRCLVVYTYHPDATTFSIHKSIIWDLRVERLQRTVLRKWQSFTIWNAGKQGRKLYNSLCGENQAKVLALCDVDQNKIGKKYFPYDPVRRKTTTSVDIVNYKDTHPPYIICIKLDLTNGIFEKILTQLNLRENTDYILFS